MPGYSAADAISPAIQRTRIFLFRPFRLGTYLKLCLVAVLTEGSSGGNFNFGNHSWARHSTSSSSNLVTPFSVATRVRPEWMALLVVFLLVGLVVGLLIAWLITRLRFAYFHCLITNTKEIRPGWHYYSGPATRFFWMNIVVGLCFVALVVVALLPFAAGIWGLVRNTASGGRPDFGAILAIVLPLIPLILLIVLAAIAMDVVLRDLMLPHYALENATAGQAWGAAWMRIRAEKGQFLFYALLRVLLPIVAAIAMVIVLIIPAIIFFVVVVGVEVGLHAGLGHSPIGILFEVLFGVVAGVLALLVVIAVSGPIETGIRQYALMFYGSRYQRLAEILWPPAPPMPAPPVPPEPNAGFGAPA